MSLRMRAMQELAGKIYFWSGLPGASSWPLPFPKLRKRQRKIVLSNIRQTDKWVSIGLAFVGGYSDAASFVLAKTFTGHVTGNLVLASLALGLQNGSAAHSVISRK